MFKFVVKLFSRTTKCWLVILPLSTSIAAEDLIPVNVFFKQETIRAPRISPDGRFFSATVKKEGKFRLAVLNLKTNKLEGIVSLRNKQSVGNQYWVNNKRIIISPTIEVGSLASPKSTGELLAVNYDGTKQQPIVGNKSNASGDSTQIVRYRLNVIDPLVKNKKFSIVQQSKYDGHTEVYKLNVYTGKKYKLTSVPGRFSQVIVDHNHVPRFAVGNDVLKDSKEDVSVVYYRKNAKSDWQLIQQIKENEAGMRPIAFDKNNNKVYLYVAAGAKNQSKNGVYLYNPIDQSKELIWENKSNVDITNILWDNDLEKQIPIGVKLDDGKPTNHFFDENNPLAKKYRQLEGIFKDEFITLTNFTTDGNTTLVIVSSDKNPGTLYKFDLKKNKINYMLTFLPGIDPKKMVNETPISFKTRDGLTIHGYLALPKGKSKNLPMVLKVHGGPYGPRDYWGFDPEDQFLANRGYAVLKVNYRGSGGYGIDFQYGAYRKMGAEMQDDLTDATLWAIKKGIADKNRICIYGGSYGGYASLMAVVKEPDLYKCAIPYAGVYDIDIQRTKSDTRRSDYGRRFLKKAWNAYDENFVKARSPYYHLDKIKAALFFAHGEDDPRVPIENYEEVSKKLNKMNYPYEHLIIDREEHGFYLEKNKNKFYSMMADFLKKNIGN